MNISEHDLFNRLPNIKLIIIKIIDYWMKVRQVIIQEPSYKRKVLTLDSSQISDRDNLLQSTNTSPKQQKLPKIFRANRYHTFQNKLDEIDEEFVTKQKNKTKNNKKNRRSVTYTYNDKSEIQRASKIFESLCKPVSSPNSVILVDRQSIKLALPNEQNYQKYYNLYNEIKKKSKVISVEDLINFINSLKTINKFFLKIDDILSLILFKKGKVIVLKQNQILYNQNDLITQFFIILWGQLKLKEIYRNKIKYCVPGNMLCQQMIYTQNKKPSKLFEDIKVSKGCLIAQQTVKSITKCGLLSINKQTLEQINFRFAQNGQKSKIQMLERLLSWSLTNKHNFRK